MALRKWNTFQEKEQWFNYKRIDRIEELLDLFYNIGSKKFFFRGMCDGSYKQYSSIQRFWDLKGFKVPFHTYVENSIIMAEPIFNRFCPRQQYNQLTLLSFLQHYGYNTPILDLTSDFNIALFFATDGAKDYQGSDCTWDYISIYAVKQEFQQDLTNLQDIIANAPDPINKDSLATYKLAIAWDTPIELCDQIVNRPNFLKLGNPNINAQKGLFILNPALDKTLDEWFDGKTFEECDYSTNNLFYGKMFCWDITKKFLPIINNYLKLKGITNQSIYPDKNYDAIKNALKSI